MFRNNMSCKPFVSFVQKTLINCLGTGAMALPHIVLLLTVEQSKPRLCHDARYLNLWMRDNPFSLDTLNDLPRYVMKDLFQTILDDKSGYDHIFLMESSQPFFGMQWGGWFFTYNTLAFGWKVSPFIYHTTGLLATGFFHSIGIPCLLYIDDRPNGQLQVSLDEGEYGSLATADERSLADAKSVIFLVAYYLVRLGYFLGLSKSILTPMKVVPYLGFLADSSRETFHLIPEKRGKFIELIQKLLESSYVSVKTLQRLTEKCVSFARAVLFTREMNAAISRGLRSQKPILLHGALQEEISRWLFFENWDSAIPWCDEHHIQISVATDASSLGWGGYDCFSKLLRAL